MNHVSKSWDDPPSIGEKEEKKGEVTPQKQSHGLL